MEEIDMKQSMQASVSKGMMQMPPNVSQQKWVDCSTNMTPANQPVTAPLRLQNLTCTVDLAVKIELKRLALSARNTEFNPKRFAAVIMRLRQPKATALIFGSGKMVITGVKTEEDGRLAARTYCKILQKLDFQPRYKDFKVQNIVATSEVGFPIRLEGLVYAHAKYASYEPELFPGLIYRLTQPRLCILIFVSGKLVFTGAKSEEDLRIALEKIYPVLVEFQKDPIFKSAGARKKV